MTKKPTTIYLGDKDRAAIAILREKYSLDSDAAAIRFALAIATSKPKPRVKREKE